MQQGRPACREGPIDEAVRATAVANALAEQEGFAATLLPIDLEYAAVEGMSGSTVARLRQRLDFGFEDRYTLLDKLGSKHRGSAHGDKKSDWIRAELAAETPLTELSSGIRTALRRWLRPVLQEVGMATPAILDA